MTSVDTAWLPPAERFDFWRDLVARQASTATIRSAHADDFVASARVVDLGTLRLGVWRYPSLEFTRPAHMIGSGDPELYQLALPLSGRGVMTQQRREGPLDPSAFALVDTVRPHGSRLRPDGATPGAVETLTLLVPHRALPLAPRRLAELCAADIPARTGMGALLAAFLRRIVAHPEQYAPTDAPHLDRIALDLLAGTLAGRLDVERDLPVDTRITGLRARVTAFVRQHLTDPDLTPATVAAAHHLSVRSLHRLFEGTGTTVGALIRTGRLERAARELADPGLGRLSVARIAARCGFAQPAHFSRAFRAAYGSSPAEHRERALRG
ncbi:helix-turn-helix domain-containing protein [Micromonospora sp. WMMC241]|uniref:AraC-like ligand-binding domain-containing protein n=1 Tax=Micromonospora sp. WMMC241 TaxID=3015159 RepID=UPI0022B62F39|nr:helix-turn-helix domain-containing protein [Micromonospora sp. WMMC241]MCZ7436308.1 helix-turn-helix domain-containing protein [Micromonospora sp. WMMC241]